MIIAEEINATINKLILASPLNFLKKAAKTFPLTFSMEHLLHRLYGVDAPDCISVCTADAGWEPAGMSRVDVKQLSLRYRLGANWTEYDTIE